MAAKNKNKSKRKRKRKPAGRRRLRRYSAEFKTNAVKLARRGDKTMRAVADDLGIPPQTLYSWVYNYEHDHGPVAPEGETPEQEVMRLRKRVARLEEEREILKKAATFFAKESE